ncbi:hypothetical protein Q4Q35_05810 [Flavivirga aquimarina]|uniref:Heavy-metal chelation domain-containing protein n=1 Tax=Flavivirga aquimarina TaxID=2027862 RepID=A0ABT8W8A7_9FLAO|nr:hypothetical protein [Flavivirga aquimarina]MDO5969316.1 hypothetical protein [Flavivirga aquimarina]
MDNTIEEIKNWIKKKADSKSHRIKGIWGIKCLFQPSESERKFNYNIIIIQTNGQGACYYEGNELKKEILETLIGQNYDFSSSINRNVEIALLDSIADSFSISPVYQYILEDTNDKKSIERAKIILKEVDLIAKCLGGGNIKVCNIGVVMTLIRLLIENNYTVSASDKDPEILEKTLFNEVQIKGYDETLRLIKESDIAVVSGMVLSTNTLKNIRDTALKHNTKIVLFAETGSSFGSFYVENNYADVVVSEPFPFYTFNGKSKIKIFKNET